MESKAGEDEFDAIPDILEGVNIDWSTIPGLAANDPLSVPPRPRSQTSSHYSSGEDFDERFLAELDALEDREVRNELNSVGGLLSHFVVRASFICFQDHHVLRTVVSRVALA